MKNKAVWKTPYRKMVRRIFLQSLVILAVAIVTILMFRSAGRGYIGNGITRALVKLTDMSRNDAQMVYFRYIGSNIDTIMLITAIAFFVVLFRFSLTWFMKYFNEIAEGVELLAEESENKIVMCHELEFMEDTMNQVKDRLEKRAKKVQEAEQRKNDLVVYLAHDIRTPLTSVIGYLNLLEENPDMTTAQKAKYVHITLEKANRLESLINEFFEITRYNLQTVPLKKERIDLYYMLIQMADEAYPQLNGRGKRIEIRAREDITVYGDADKLARVFNNILKNAIVYSEEDSTISISAEMLFSESVIRFENAGIIPQDKLESIFEKFYRLDDARSSDTGGAGLGLAIARDIVTLHGGTVEAQSSKDQTVFTIRLPNPR